MFSSAPTIQSIVHDFRLDQMMRYSLFAPRLYNLCRAFGMQAGNIMPSRAFCSDENQGYPIMLIAKHFGAFPFNHGRVGGIVATDRHGPHSHHGQDLMIIQASHVGFDPETQAFGQYTRPHTCNNDKTTTCGKIGGVLHWYQQAYHFAGKNIHLGWEKGKPTVCIDNQLLDNNREQGLFLNLEKMIATEAGQPYLLRVQSTSRLFVAAPKFYQQLKAQWSAPEQSVPIGTNLAADLFQYRRDIDYVPENSNHMEHNLINFMPWIVTAKNPLLIAAQVNTQAEFDRCFRSISQDPAYDNKRLLFISCLHIDISPAEGQLFPLTKCIPWAAYLQDGQGHTQILEQQTLIEQLLQQDTQNPDQIDIETEISQMSAVDEVKIPLTD